MFDKRLKKLLELPRHQKRLIQIAADIVLLSLSFFLAMSLRLEGFWFLSSDNVWQAPAIVIPITILIFIKLGFYRAVIRYITDKALTSVVLGVLISAILMGLVGQYFSFFVPRSVPFIYGILAFLSVGGLRFVMRAMFSLRRIKSKTPVIIYGAGESGRQLQSSLRQGNQYNTIAYIDEAKDLHNIEIGGLRVYRPIDLASLIEDYDIKVVLLAVPSATRAQRAKIVKWLEVFPVQVRTIPGIGDLVTGKAKINDLQEIAVEDFLGRDPVPPDESLMDANIRDQNVMVTGAGGSIGSELCRQVLKRHPKTLILFDVSEFALYKIEEELRRVINDGSLETQLVPILGSVQREELLKNVMTSFEVNTVFHAAAYKHVPLVEQNVVQGIRNNIFGTLATVEAAVESGVSSFILISTDKAVRPTNIMGATKRFAELICQSMAARQQQTRFSMVRFGNVLGSSGSVIPKFRDQISKGGPITVTHPEITRYFMTIPEASQLVIQAGAMANGGEVYVLDMGESVKIVDLAIKMARMHGFTPYFEGEEIEGGDIAIGFTGLRDGEKLYEELLISQNSSKTSHPRIMSEREEFLPWDALSAVIGEIDEACRNGQIETLHDIIKSAPTGYDNAYGVRDLVQNARKLSVASN